MRHQSICRGLDGERGEMPPPVLIDFVREPQAATEAAERAKGDVTAAGLTEPRTLVAWWLANLELWYSTHAGPWKGERIIAGTWSKLK